MLYERNIIGTSSEIFGFLRQSSAIFGKCSKNVRRRSSSLRNNFGKSSESGRKSSESRHKRRLYNKQNNTWTLGDMEFIFSCSHSISHSFAALTRSISMWTLEDNFHISARPCIMYCLKHEQQCFIGFKNTRRSRVFLNPIKHVLRVFWTASKIRDNTYLRIFLLFQKPEKTRAREFFDCFKNPREHVHANSCAASKTRENACISIDKNSVVFVESFLSRSFLPQCSLFP